MTKLNVNIGGKPQQAEEGPEAPTKQPEAQPENGQEKSPEALPACSYDIPSAYTGIDWRFIWRMSHIQFFLSMISSFCLLCSLHFTGFNVFRFTSSAWATYLACVAVVGIRAGRYRNYSYLVAYTGMVTFQTVIYMSSLCWLAYSLYALDYSVNYSYRGGYMSSRYHDFAMALIIAEILSLLATIFTGIFGLVAVCRGLGKMLHELENFILDQRYPAPQITVRPIV